MSMAIEEQRIASFTSTRPAWPHPTSAASTSRSKATRSHHPYPTPKELAAASLYFSPSPDAPDNCTSFIDGSNLADWQPGEDPLERLAELKPQHPWVLITRSAREAEEHPPEHKSTSKAKKTTKRTKSRAADKTVDVTQDPDSFSQYSWTEDALLPDSKTMVAARKATFGKEWPHDSKRGWSCTSAKLAAAGFHYDPSAEEPDNAVCAYCTKPLAGWEKNDDPIYEHQRRRPECPFFNVRTLDGEAEAAEDGEKAKSEEPAARSTSGGRPVKNSRKKRNDRSQDDSGESSVLPADDHDEQDAAIPAPDEGGASMLMQPKPEQPKLKAVSADAAHAPQPPGDNDQQVVIPSQAVSAEDRKKTVGEYLSDKANQALEEMRAQGQAKIEHLRKRFYSERAEIEALLTGQRKSAKVRSGATAGGSQAKGDDGGAGSSRRSHPDDDEDNDGAVFGAESKALPKKGKAKSRPKLPTFSVRNTAEDGDE
ncbi:hypothetical protein OC842_000297 [Tilletia horrida]|uniref:Inhibitor of apoptosis repeat-containing protein n=1 Tax=Tilletia horrida TaxID=155126 RepID=A0AAN6JNI5_9BASI|nr:hypothetical protein OC842_000297 [Tilletia horrida]KAK0560332.1 hypothetical protein OC844_003836 [Tilletia horrida]